METKKVRRAIIAAAGFGTRFLGWTKSMPKEMLPLGTKPIIQYVVEELVSAGIEEIYIIGSSNKRAIEDHFDMPNSDLLENLRAGGVKKLPYIEKIESIANLADFNYKRQKGPYGNATPITTAAGNIGDEPFIYTFADDFFKSNNGKGRTKQMIETYEELGGSVLACKKITDDGEYDRYGVVAGEKISESLYDVATIDEKPGKKAARSNLASVSGYLFEPDIIKYLVEAQEVHNDDDGEFMIQPVIQQMIEDGYKFYAKEIVNATYHDTGDVTEYYKTVFSFMMADEEIGEKLRNHARLVLSELENS
ncbi:UTP--glucose-1-phosphate uridylyltransferase [Candidatus Saccharibacteria bacterium]|jgi:UTP--glucose-1-phosphate uridylyltransferase|nr:UTP--glucose-1-phosphate uridylyltransferase [Candidatus Saccharibacteria bacterium]